MTNFLKIFKNKKIFVTGHNGFKGSWLTIWLNLLGAKVVGVSLKDNNPNNHFNLVRKKIKVKSYYFDICKPKIGLLNEKYNQVVLLV